MRVAISWANKMQLAKCDIMVGFQYPVTYSAWQMTDKCIGSTEMLHSLVNRFGAIVCTVTGSLKLITEAF